jgi:hypothetical protein
VAAGAARQEQLVRGREAWFRRDGDALHLAQGEFQARGADALRQTVPALRGYARTLG